MFHKYTDYSVGRSRRVGRVWPLVRSVHALSSREETSWDWPDSSQPGTRFKLISSNDRYSDILPLVSRLGPRPPCSDRTLWVFVGTWVSRLLPDLVLAPTRGGQEISLFSLHPQSRGNTSYIPYHVSRVCHFMFPTREDLSPVHRLSCPKPETSVRRVRLRNKTVYNRDLSPFKEVDILPLLSSQVETPNYTPTLFYISWIFSQNGY